MGILLAAVEALAYLYALTLLSLQDFGQRLGDVLL